MPKIDAQKKLTPLLIASIGVIYGDIGTSPLYALKSCFKIGSLALVEANILGIISLFIWSLTLVVSFKYVYLVLKMDHQGEGGTLALSTLVAYHSKYRLLAMTLGIIGAALLFGDGTITPAISILSAVEGISVISPHLSRYVIPFTLVILTALFSVQKYGSSRIGYFFGPIMIGWFLTLFLLGIRYIVEYPKILYAFNPYYAFSFLFQHGWLGFSVMGGVILVVTGAEALYADLGHFGRKPIQLSWNYIVFPALLCNYLGQGALLLHSPEAITNPFYLMAPSWALNGLVILATAATIIASQAILTGLFSVAYQCILLNYLPRLKVKHTSEALRGQIYIPDINFLIYVLTMIAILKFGSSESLAAIYGLCVASIMMITTLLVFILAATHLKWSKFKIITVFVPFFCLDFLFLSSNFTKFLQGAWYVVLITAGVFYCIRVWRRGSYALEKQKVPIQLSLQDYIEKYLKIYSARIPGTAIFLSRVPFKVPATLAVNLRHNKWLHEKVFFVSFIILDTPYHDTNNHFDIQELPNNTFQITINSGFMEKPNLNALLHWLKQKSLLNKEDEISIFMSKSIPMRTKEPFLSEFSEHVYFYLYSIAQSATDFYQAPDDKVMEIGIRYKI
ncbi:MAG: Kup system potassium uptake protein [Gammaproteobacteria bacterium]|jgi:KUP system potassium uptake protein|nr:Kup system potassium uptake protein [Gammaproteobacteria bacterium]